ncbi:hypothetical protein [Rhodovarius sp.]|uniref:hypothetical protein n=1 Tax=Rhodovarius sp. TaxID=2972673 RepID=UPI0034A155E1
MNLLVMPHAPPKRAGTGIEQMKLWSRLTLLLPLLLVAACGTAQIRLEQVGPASSLPPHIVPDMRYLSSPVGIVVMLSSETDIMDRNNGLGILQLAVELCPALERRRPWWDGDRYLLDHDSINDELGRSLRSRLPFGPAPRRPDGRINYWIPIRAYTPRRVGTHRSTGLEQQWTAEHDMRRDPRDICITITDVAMLREPRFSNTLVIPAAAVSAALAAEP